MSEPRPPVRNLDAPRLLFPRPPTAPRSRAPTRSSGVTGPSAKRPEYIASRLFRRSCGVLLSERDVFLGTEPRDAAAIAPGEVRPDRRAASRTIQVPAPASA